ncbi:SPOR domain-containing protein [Vibrio metschnikovii]|uniref:SPOR domain-containing protein n=1 Tax=Vibrio metschnikovii TaxID=28172 RepID=UPI00315C9BF7
MRISTINTAPRGLVYLLLGGALFFNGPLFAQEVLCEATQASSEQLPVLASHCPIGDGLWGNSQPRSSQSQFWIQCGLLDKPLSLEQAKLIYQQISTHVWMKPEGRATRCLIGPYDSFTQARSELMLVNNLAAYRDAFIREIRPSAPPSSTVTTPTTDSPAKQAERKVAESGVAAIQPLRSARPVSVSEDVEIRHQATINGTTYVVPYSFAKNKSFYMEHNQPWNRLSYDEARTLCQQQTMRLVNQQEWQQLLTSQIAERDQWPLYIPYWGEGRKGLFASGKVTQLQGNSKLNVLCVKSVSQ